MHAIPGLYFRYAVALLGLTLLAGVHMRLAVVWPGLRGGIGGMNLVHAHSHAAFFGWAVMAAFALVTARAVPAGWRVTAHRGLAHVTGVASAAAFVGFALRGYDAATIALSAFHVLLWLVFTALVWRDLGALSAGAQPFVRAGLLFLAGAGLATTAPVLMLVRGTTDPWLQQLGVKLFLTPFVSGFLLLTALAVACDACRATRGLRAALVLIAAGVLPSTVLYVAAAPPAEWLTWVGRGGMALLAAGTLLFVGTVVLQVRPSPRLLSPLGALVLLMAVAKAGLELLAAAGVGAAFMHNRAITIAVLHLVLLGVVTPAFLLGMRPRLRAPALTALYGTGLVALSVSVGVLGWPWAALQLATRGVPFDALFAAAAVSGVLVAATLLALCVVREAAQSTMRPPAPGPRAVRPGRTHDAAPTAPVEPSFLTRTP